MVSASWDMTWSHLGMRLVRHTLWAILCFCGVAITAEWLAPGSFMPYADPLPWAIVALFGLAWDACGRSVVVCGRLGRFVLAIALLIATAGALMLASGIHGRLDALALGFFFGGGVVIAWIMTA
jgi:hypothetical protein